MFVFIRLGEINLDWAKPTDSVLKKISHSFERPVGSVVVVGSVSGASVVGWKNDDRVLKHLVLLKDY